MKLTVKVTRGSEVETIKVSPLAFIGWEKITGRKMSSLSSDGLGMLDLATLAMEQQRLEGGDVADTVEGYLAGVDELDPATEDPTPGSGEASSAP